MTASPIQTRRRQRIAVFVAVLAMLALVVWFVNRDAESSGRPLTQPSPSAVPSPATSPPADFPSDQSSKALDAALDGELPPIGADLPGLPGGSLSRDVPPLNLTITVTSSAPIGTVGYVIPMSKDKPSGRADKVGRSWSLSTTVYGKPDYARVFLQAGARGDAITCVITVNGRVTERKSTVGPYGALMCQG